MVSSEDTTDGHAANAADGTTSDFWKPTALPATLEVQLSTSTPADFAAIAAHTLAGRTVKVQRHDGTAWVDVASVVAVDNAAFALQFTEASATRWRFEISGGTGLPVIGVAFIGKALRVERRMFQGHTVVTMADDVELLVNTSESGHLLGTSVLHHGAGTAFAFSNLSPQWVRTTFEPFRQHFNTGKPFFWLWRPEDYPDEVAYCWRDGGTIKPTNSGPRDLMSVQGRMRAYVDND